MRKNAILRLTITALMMALCYVSFTYLKISIPTPAGYTAFHLGNTFCLLASLLLGGVTGGIAGAIGMGIADIMDPVYITVAPKTLILKMMIGVVCGLLAHRVFKIREKEGKKLYLFTALSCLGAMICNIIGEPVFGYFYYTYILSMPEKGASTLAKFNAVTTSVNAILAVVIATVLYVAVWSRFRNSDILDRLMNRKD